MVTLGLFVVYIISHACLLVFFARSILVIYTRTLNSLKGQQNSIIQQLYADIDKEIKAATKAIAIVKNFSGQVKINAVLFSGLHIAMIVTQMRIQYVILGITQTLVILALIPQIFIPFFTVSLINVILSVVKL